MTIQEELLSKQEEYDLISKKINDLYQSQADAWRGLQSLIMRVIKDEQLFSSMDFDLTLTEQEAILFVDTTKYTKYTTTFIRLSHLLNIEPHHWHWSSYDDDDFIELYHDDGDFKIKIPTSNLSQFVKDYNIKINESALEKEIAKREIALQEIKDRLKIINQLNEK